MFLFRHVRPRKCSMMPHHASEILLYLSEDNNNSSSPLFSFLKVGGKWCAFRAGLGKLQKQIRFWSLIKNTPTKRLSQLEKSRLTEKTYSRAPIETLKEMLVHQQPINVQRLRDPRALNETGLWMGGGGSLRKGASWQFNWVRLGMILNDLERSKDRNTHCFSCGSILPSRTVRTCQTLKRERIITVISSIENKQTEDAACMWCVDDITESVCQCFLYTYINSW